MHVDIVREDFDTGDLPFLSDDLSKKSYRTKTHWQDFWRSHDPRALVLSIPNFFTLTDLKNLIKKQSCMAWGRGYLS
jgi:hypothetical protein